MKLQTLLESFDPRRFLLHVQQLLLDKYPNADVELNIERVDSYVLEIKYFDLKQVTFSLFKDDNSTTWTFSLSGHTTIYPQPFNEQTMKPEYVVDAVETMLKGSFEEMVAFENDCGLMLYGNTEAWVYAEIGKLFKYLSTGRLKKAADVHIVVDKELDDEGLQKLETRYNSTLINSKKLPPRLNSSGPSSSDANNVSREVYILADLW